MEGYERGSPFDIYKYGKMKQAITSDGVQKCHNDSHAAEISTNALETNEPKEKGHKGKGSVSIAPHEGSKDHTGQQGGITNDAQGTTDGENKVEENI